MLIISHDEMKGIIEIIKSLDDSGLLLKGVSEIQNDDREQKGGFLSMLLGTPGASLLEKILRAKGVVAKRINRAKEEVIKAGYGNERRDHKNKMGF